MAAEFCVFVPGATRRLDLFSRQAKRLSSIPVFPHNVCQTYASVSGSSRRRATCSASANNCFLRSPCSEKVSSLPSRASTEEFDHALPDTCARGKVQYDHEC